jgi:D-alanyl-lipoteichoic acid acyltransferase DltB (MBOAT superfamily)
MFYGIPEFRIILPIGISFYTFQTLSYTIDVYRGKKEAERHLGVFALYVAFFPQLVAGPIERSTRLLPQFFRKYYFDYRRVTDGLQLMLWGFFKKLVIADRLAVYVNQVYNNPADYHGVPLILATYFFTFQIYCDFSGYSDIAIGAAQVMGYNLMENFKRPYFSKSITEFWRRWHISLSSWFRDYLYIPLGGNRVHKWRWYYNIIAVFLLSGLWHGANWTFVVWGGLHGFYILFSLWTDNLRNKISSFLHTSRFPTIQKLFKVFITFHLVVFAWIFFRANSISDAFLILANITRIDSWQCSISGALNKIELIVAFLSILLLGVIHLIQAHTSVRTYLNGKPIWFRWACYYVIVFFITLFGKFEEQQFIYFQF